jgi:hypothetical protein
MVLILHVLCALFSIGLAALAFFMPSKLKIRLSQTLVLLTLSSGIYLVASAHANMISVCISGLIYIIIVSFEIVYANNKLTGEKYGNHQ